MQEKKERKCRKILWSPFLDRHIVSYGIIMYCVPTKKWLLVNRKHSPEFITLMRGSYRAVDIPYILQGISKKEKELVATIKTKETFLDCFRITISDESVEEDEQYAWTRFADALPLLDYLLPLISCEENIEWLFPKGRLSGDETQKQCAEREFFEETGLDIYSYSTDIVKPTSHTYVESFRGIANSRLYETRCWLYLAFEELPLISNVEREQQVGGEIGKVEWMTTERACSLLKPSKKNIILEVLKLISR